MKRESVFLKVLLIILVISSFAALEIQSVEASGTIYIRANGIIDPPTAPISTIDNVIYTFTDDIFDSIVVERNDVVVDGVGYTVQENRTGFWSGYGIDLSGRTNVTVLNTHIKGFDDGIRLWASYGNSVGGNTLTNNSVGILVSSSSSNIISGNNINANNHEGIYLYNSSSNNIIGNNITDNTYGIQFVDSCNYNTISGNHIADCQWGIWFDLCNYNSISGNNITDGIYGIQLSFHSTYANISGNNITNNEEGIILQESSDNSIIGNNITANDMEGIWLSSSSNNSISENSIADNGDGIVLSSSPWNNASSYNNISRNTFMNDGLIVRDYSYHNVVENNTVNGKPLVYLEDVADYSIDDAGQVILVNCTGIRVENLNLSRTDIGAQSWQTGNSSITGNIIANNGDGIVLRSSPNISIIGNNITANDMYGIWLSSSSNISISENSIAENKWGGIWFDYSSNYASICRNNITANDYGISLQYSSGYANISGNNITANNDYGIGLGSSNNSITENTVAKNDRGIFLGSTDNSVRGNNLTDNRIGLSLWESSNNTISDNTITNNTITNNNLYGIMLHSSSRNNISNNYVANRLIGIVLEYSSDYNNMSENTITNSTEGIHLRDSSNHNRISRNNITNSECGIRPSNSPHTSIIENTIENNYYGINLESTNTSISKNNITNNYYGVLLSCTGSSVSGNTFTDDGLAVSYSCQNSVENNTVNGKPLVYLEGVANHSMGDAGQVILVNCTGIRVENLNLSRTSVGVQLWETNSSIISGNSITANNHAGIWLDSSANNSICGNNIADNNYGVLLEGSHQRFYYNSFINNSQQVGVYGEGYANVWENSYASGGNYWSDYNGTSFDTYGIGYDPYVICESNTDHCPLMNPYLLGDVNHDAKVDIVDMTIIAKAFASQLGGIKWDPHADMDENGKINIVDISKAAKEFGKEWKADII